MRKNKPDDQIEDWRSTGRRRARRVLFESMIEFKCCDCGVTTATRPKEAPPWFDDLWPEENRTASQLQADHVSKDVTLNDVDDLCWRCPSCHKLADIATEKGVSQVDDPHGYGDAYAL